MKSLHFKCATLGMVATLLAVCPSRERAVLASAGPRLLTAQIGDTAGVHANINRRIAATPFAPGQTASGGAGSLVAWGDNGLGQCTVPSPNMDFVSVADGYWHSIGLKSDGSIVVWGDNSFGQRSVPFPNTGYVAIAGHGFQCLGLKTDGSIVAWGDNSYGQCDVPLPNTEFTAVAGGYHHSLGLKADGSIVAWGDDSAGQCDVPAPNAGFVAVAAGYYHSLGLKSDGSVVAWGQNDDGRCTVPAPNAGFVAIAGAFYHSVGLKADGSVVAWGHNEDGRCNVPPPNAGFTGIAAGGGSTLGIKADGSIVGWGSAGAPPPPNANFVAAACGALHWLALHGVVTDRGACCLADGTCLYANQSECLPPAVYQGSGTYCQPRPCVSPLDACCFHDSHCEVLTESNCFAVGGTYTPNEGGCVPNPCPRYGGGPNEGGTLIVHAAEGLVYSSGTTDYCLDLDIADCSHVDDSVTGSDVRIFYALAAFPPGSSPRLSRASFGVDYDYPNLQLIAHGACSDTESAGSGWPAPNTGTSLAWTAPQSSKLTTMYWFAGYNYYSPTSAHFSVIAHPTAGGYFVDDSQPPYYDPVEAYGTLGFDEPGSHSCPPDGSGACCTGVCAIRLGSECDALGGTFYGSGSTCVGLNCSYGACCDLMAGTCVIVTPVVCSLGGNRYQYQGDGTFCVPNPCPIPTGACCQVEGCTQTSEPDCSGAFLGIGTDCDDCATGVNPASAPVDSNPRARPNPSSGSTTISFSLARPGWASLRIYDATGRSVRLLSVGEMTAGPHALTWDGRSDAGELLPAGIYFSRVQTGAGVMNGRVVRR